MLFANRNSTPGAWRLDTSAPTTTARVLERGDHDISLSGLAVAHGHRLTDVPQIELADLDGSIDRPLKRPPGESQVSDSQPRPCMGASATVFVAKRKSRGCPHGAAAPESGEMRFESVPASVQRETSISVGAGRGVKVTPVIDSPRPFGPGSIPPHPCPTDTTASRSRRPQREPLPPHRPRWATASCRRPSAERYVQTLEKGDEQEPSQLHRAP
jgi:hypothetical protein